MAKILIKNGKVYEPLFGTEEIRDVCVCGGRIVSEFDKDDADIVIDSKDCMVVPGLIDHHIHLYQGTDGGVNADLSCLPSGVTTAVDGGSCGMCNYTQFHNFSIANSIVTVKSYLNIAPIGLGTGFYPENLDVNLFPKYDDRIKELFARYKGELVSIKLRLTKDVTSSIDPLVYCIKLADEIGCNVVVHVTRPSVPCEEIASVLRPGDVFCHVYQGVENTILDENGKIKKQVLEARKRGVIFDACNGKKNFAFSVAKGAIKQGFFPDIISSDMSPLTFYADPVVSLPHLMSKYLAFGLSCMDVFKMTTTTPAKVIGIKDYGSLTAGNRADIALFKIKKQGVRFYDCNNEFIEGDQVIVPQMTIKKGNIVYRQTDFTSVKYTF
ncbi:amidohydrolase family protein [Treponema parvum]|uniref:Amidohydrolase family protein n=1 Tax=Treponema parvum TaxID=138851 RepID=A0A975IBI8_9SPIR|nr:amidohydrolase family protein [Treponema parvum]QTQ10873.1 amidohydrolase family protein [Treponema parvum]